jgi:CubicO group peptidase (beta-lactamase class C family)
MGATETFSLEVVDPVEVGMDAGRLDRVKRAVEADTSAGTYDGAVFIVARHGKVVMREAVGKADVEKGREASLDDVFFLMSLTKQFTAVRVLMDIEQGKYLLTTPICEVIPEFGIKGKQRVNVRHILTHTSGLNTEIPYGLPVDQLPVIESVVQFMCNERILFQPGTIVSYNAIASMSLLGAMVQRLDEKGRAYRKILAEDIFEPLGMTSTALGLPDTLKSRIVPVVVRDRTPGLFEPLLLEAFNFLANEELELPSGGGVSTADDIFRFAEMLRRGGELDGARIISRESLKMATSNQTGELVNYLYDYVREMYGWPVFPAYLGLTFFLRGEGIHPSPLGLMASPGTFAGLGAGSNMFMIDPERDLTFVYLSAGLLEEASSYLRLQRLADMVIASITD